MQGLIGRPVDRVDEPAAPDQAQHDDPEQQGREQPSSDQTDLAGGGQRGHEVTV